MGKHWQIGMEGTANLEEQDKMYRVMLEALLFNEIYDYQKNRLLGGTPFANTPNEVMKGIIEYSDVSFKSDYLLAIQFGGLNAFGLDLNHKKSYETYQSLKMNSHERKAVFPLSFPSEVKYCGTDPIRNFAWIMAEEKK